jgi:ABC-type Zn uptake system ZnuABC Zn-binding protein ZnuA
MRRHATPLSGLLVVVVLLATVIGSAGCGSDDPGRQGASLHVVASTSYLADIAQNVAGTRLRITSLLPEGADPHSFEPSPRDAKTVAESRAIIINTPGFEPLVDSLIESAGRPNILVIEAGAGMAGRTPSAEESDGAAGIDPHFWLDPLKVVAYVKNISQGLSVIDPAGAETYSTNARTYAQRLLELDKWIVAQVDHVPADRRLLVTDHESFGYFADRYGFRIVGTVFPTLGTEGTPSAKQLLALVHRIRATGAPAIFLETGSSADLARQVARETGVKVVTDLYTHSLGPHAGTYLDMMRWNVDVIVEALR